MPQGLKNLPDVFTSDVNGRILKASLIAIAVIFLAQSAFVFFTFPENAEEGMNAIRLLYASLLSIMSLFTVPAVSFLVPFYSIPIYVASLLAFYLGVRYLLKPLLVLYLSGLFILTYLGLFFVTAIEFAGV